MKLSQLEMALGTETLAPTLLIFCFLITRFFQCSKKVMGGCGCIYTHMYMLQGFQFSKSDGGPDVVVYIQVFLITVHLISGRTTHT